jgi:phosphonate transport system substrate-binding protein
VESSRLQFGLVPPPSFVGVEAHVNALLRWVGDRAGVMLVRRQVASYDDLARLLRGEVLNVAWLPPIPFARLEVEGVVRELACADRGGGDALVSVLLARAGSSLATLEDLRGKRVAWVDPLSATGYVVPRMRLAASGRPPAGFFAKETFFGSHRAVVRAVLDGVADVGATYAGLEDGRLARGAWTDLGAIADDLAMVETFGRVPSDVIAVHSRVPEPVAQALAEAFEATREDPAALEAVRLTFGAVALVRRPLVGYDLLRSEIEHGVDSGVIPDAAAFLSTRPPR